jgi:DNA-binding phage protein
MATSAETRKQVSERWNLISKYLNEAQRRLLAAAETKVLGPGNVSAVAEATGFSRPTLYDGLKELESGDVLGPYEIATAGRVRRAGGGRPRLVDTDPSLLSDLEALVEPTSRGDPMSPLRWTCKSLRTLAAELKAKGHEICKAMVGTLLKTLDYTLQGNAKTHEGEDHPDRNAQFEHINREVQAALATGQPVISVDAKKKELVGPHKNGGCSWRPQGEPEQVDVYDFVGPNSEHAIPYGVYDIRQNAGWVNVGIAANTAQFAVQSIRSWWYVMGKALYAGAKTLVVTADSGGGNGYRVRLWKYELQKFADEIGLAIKVCHFPAGTSKWNKIEHRLFSFISMNWCGQPLLTYEIIVSLIAGTRNASGLRVNAELDTRIYETGIEITDEQWNSIRLQRDDFHGEWNYTIMPHIASHGVVYAAKV